EPLAGIVWAPTIPNFTLFVYAAALLALMIAYQLKLLYFELESSVGAGAHALVRGPFLKGLWILLHYPLLMAIVLQSEVFMRILRRPEHPIGTEMKWRLCGSVACFLVVLAWMAIM